MTDEDLIHADASPDLSQSGQQSSVPTGKTIGHRLYDAMHPDPEPAAQGAHPMPFLLQDPSWQHRYEIGAAAIIEECAKIAEQNSTHLLRDGVTDAGYEGGARNQRLLTAAAIRSLKSDKPHCDQLHAATMVAEARTFLWSETAGPCRNCGEIKPLMEVRDCFECVMELTKLWSSSGETRRKRRRTKAPPERQGDRPESGDLL